MRLPRNLSSQSVRSRGGQLEHDARRGKNKHRRPTFRTIKKKCFCVSRRHKTAADFLCCIDRVERRMCVCSVCLVFKCVVCEWERERPKHKQQADACCCVRDWVFAMVSSVGGWVRTRWKLLFLTDFNQMPCFSYKRERNSETWGKWNKLLALHFLLQIIFSFVLFYNLK